MMRCLLLLCFALSACQPKSDVDKCVDAATKVFNERNPHASSQDRDYFKARIYHWCMGGR